MEFKLGYEFYINPKGTLKATKRKKKQKKIMLLSALLSLSQIKFDLLSNLFLSFFSIFSL
jgi:hypothetical protein